MGSGLRGRRGTLRKPAECHPPPRPPVVVPLCSCRVELSLLGGPLRVKAITSGCRPFFLTGLLLVTHVQSAPNLVWQKNTETTNCDVSGEWVAPVFMHPATYRVDVSFEWLGGLFCTASESIFIP